MLAVSAQKSFGQFTVDVSFATEIDGVIALFGASGAGKTTIVDMIAGLVRPESGRIALGDRVLFDSAARIDLRPEQRRVGYVFQDARLFPHFNVRRNLLYGLRFAPRNKRYANLDEIVALLGLETLLARRPRTLSGGERQRVALGRALMAQPDLLLMDEPLAALDLARRAEILDYVERLRDEIGVPIVYVSHAMDEVARLAGTMVVLADGRVAASGPTGEIMARLDLDPLAGVEDAGAILNATVDHHDEAFGLTALAVPGGTLRVPRLDLPPGRVLRVRIRARDISLATTEPRDISVLNVFRGHVVEIGQRRGASVDVAVDMGARLRARITARSAHILGLEAGTPVYALIKSVAVDPGSLAQAAHEGLHGNREPETLPAD
jgi:molybdate transport system ATP-binding protein